jgi:hypothetical protein
MPNYLELSKGCCKGCPFNDGLTDEASIIQNYGCLPDKFDIVENHEKLNQVWACHAKPHKVCRGLINHCNAEKLPVPDHPTAGETFGEWGAPTE